MTTKTRETQATTQAIRTGTHRLVIAAVALLLMAMALAHPVDADEHGTDSIQLSISPQSGPPGTQVTVDASDIPADAKLYFGGIAVSYERQGGGQIGFTVPNQPASEYQVDIKSATGNGSVCCFTILGDETESDDNASTQVDPDPTIPDEEECDEKGWNVQCNTLGTIKMPSQRNIKGEPVKISTTVTLNSDQSDAGARYFLFSIRNVTDFGESPVSIRLDGFSTPVGDIITNRVDEKGQYELNIWVHVLDVPAQVPITLDMTVGSTDRGAYILETLVMPFDRGYEPLTSPDGEDLSLYSFTLLGVNDATGSLGSNGGGPLSKVSTPGFGLVAGLAAIGLAAVAASRRERL